MEAKEYKKMSNEYQNPESICIFGTGTIQTATSGLAKEAYFDGGDMIVVVENEEDLATLTPDYDAMCKVDGRGLVITAKSKDYDFVSRSFYPKLYVPEDPVTGSAHTYLPPPLVRQTGKDRNARQTALPPRRYPPCKTGRSTRLHHRPSSPLHARRNSV